MKLDKKRKISSSPLCLISALAWGISFPFQEMASENSHLLDSFGFNGLRLLLASLVLIPVVLIFEKNADYSKKRVLSTIKYGAIAGVVLVSASSFQQFGIEITKEAGKAGFITSLYQIIVPIIAFIIFKQRPSKFVLIAMPFSIAGLYFLSFADGIGKFNSGDLLVVACSFLYALHIIVLDRSAKMVNPLLFSAIQFFVAGIIGTTLGSTIGIITTEGITKTYLPIIFCGVFSVGVAYTLQLLGQKNGNPTVCALFCSMEALFAVIAECIMESKLPSIRMVIGCGLMLIAIVLAQLPADVFKRKAN